MALPVVTFTSQDGVAVRFTGATHVGRFGGPRTGATVPVRYDRGDPGQARIATLRGSFTGPAIGLLAGVALLGLFAVAVHDRRAGDAASTHDPADRRAVYLPLQLAATELAGCTGGACTVREARRTLNAYEGAKAVAMTSGEVSPAVETQMAALERSRIAAHVGRGQIGRALRAPLVALAGQLLGELSADGCSSACVSGYSDRR